MNKDSYKVFILEDEESRIEKLMRLARRDVEFFRVISFFVARSVDEACSILNTNRSFDIGFIDHDLGSDKTGVDVAKVIVDNRVSFGNCIIHSMNVVGANNIKNLLASSGFSAFVSPFRSLMMANKL